MHSRHKKWMILSLSYPNCYISKMDCTTSLNERDLQNFIDTLDDLRSTKHEFTIGKHTSIIMLSILFIYTHQEMKQNLF